MTELFKDQHRLEREMERRFPGRCYDFETDPDDSGIVYVKIYGVEDGEYGRLEKDAWDMVYEMELEETSLVPMMVRMEDTRKYHEEKLREGRVEEEVKARTIRVLIEAQEEEEPVDWPDEIKDYRGEGEEEGKGGWHAEIGCGKEFGMAA